MQKVFILILFTIFSVSFGRADTASSLEEAKSMAAKTGKPILMDFMTEW